FLFIAFFACLAIVALGWRYGRHRLLSERHVAARQADAVAAALKKGIDTTEFAGQERPWGEVLSALAARSDVPLSAKDEEVKSMGVDPQTRVYVPTGVFPLGELLEEITGHMDLGWRRSAGSIEITSIGEAETGRQRLHTRIYPLPPASAAGEALADDAEAMCELLITHIVPESWEEVGGQGVIAPAGGAVVVRQTDDIHVLIREFLSQMESSGGWPGPLDEDHAAAEEEQRVAQALAEIDSVDFRDMPLDEGLRTLMARHGLRFQFSSAALANGAANPAIPTTLSLSSVSLRTILRELLGGQKLTWVVRGGLIQVTTIDEADSLLSHGVYDVRDLIEGSGPPDFDSLIELVTTTVEPESWDEVGGPGTISEMGDRWLVVSQTQENQQKVQRLLARVRAILEPGVDPAADALLEPVDDVAPAIRQALDGVVTLKYDQRKLADVCRDLSQQLAIPVMPRMRPDSTIALDAQVTIELPPLPLGDALSLMLEEHLLTFDPRGEVLYITTPEDAEENLVTRIIDVRHLLDPGSGGLDEDTFIELITNCVAPDQWDEVGGPGSQDVFRGLLIFRQTYEISRQVQALIDALSERCLRNSAEIAAAAARKPVWVGISREEQAILEKLHTPVSLSTKGAKVEEVIREVCRQCAIPIQFDRFWRDDVPVANAKFTVDLSPEQISGWEAIMRIEARNAAGIIVNHGILLVTHPDYDASRTTLRLYPLSLPKRDDLPRHAEQVAVMLVDRLDRDAWSDNGGYGIVMPVTDEWLLVAQTLPMHRRVEEALAKLQAGEMLPIPADAGEYRSPLASPAIGSLWRVMRRVIPWPKAYDAE
ncbi:MAG TPA: hypothetical protein VFB96_16930, partial [Pirellulaceae bacterium]|nr:hypothetical protein [Pirellulaceae bacterium]